MGGTLRIVGVHGVGNLQEDKSPDDAAAMLSRWWMAALQKHALSAEDEVRVAYYAHILQSHGDSSRVSSARISEDATQWAGELGAPLDDGQGPLTAPLRWVIDWVANKYNLNQRHVENFVRTFFPEILRYFQPETRETVLQQVCESIVATKPDVVIAHSLGSVVAFEALSRMPEFPIPVFVTLGSPLAMPHVICPQVAQHSPLAKPAAVERWLNVFDQGDIIAIPSAGLGEVYSGVSADIRTTVGAFQFHRVTNYLNTSTLHAILAMARDLP